MNKDIRIYTTISSYFISSKQKWYVTLRPLLKTEILRNGSRSVQYRWNEMRWDEWYERPFILMVHSHTLRWDGMKWAAPVTQCISVETFTHWVTSAAHHIPSYPRACVCECTIMPLTRSDVPISRSEGQILLEHASSDYTNKKCMPGRYCDLECIFKVTQ